jgi:tetratricopeptide (TPR) repeat protein
MAKKKVTEEIEQPIITEKVDLDETQKLKSFWDKYSKPFLIGLAAGVLIFGGYWGYKKLISEPKEMKAAEAIFPAEAIFDQMDKTGFTKDSINLALNGGNANGVAFKGLLKVIGEYGGTACGNRANYLVGASYMHNGEFEKSIKHLKDFDANGAYQMDIKRNLMLGNDYAELKKTDEALAAFKSATTINAKDNALTADALFMAGRYAKKIGKTKEAIELFQKLKDDYPADQAVQAGEVDKNLATLGVTK